MGIIKKKKGIFILFLALSSISSLPILSSCQNLSQIEEVVNPVLEKPDLVKALRTVYLKGVSNVSVKETQKGLEIVIPDNLLFNGDDIYTVNGNGTKILRKIMQLYKDEIVRGYPDNIITVVGEDTKSEDRGKKKAETIAKFIKTYNVNEESLFWYGKKTNTDQIKIYIDLEK